MDNLQIIKSPKGEEMVVISRKEYNRLTDLAFGEDAHDAALASAQIKKGSPAVSVGKKLSI